MSDSVIQLLDFVQEELEGADEYANLARHYKATDGALSKLYADIALQELTHVELFMHKASELYANEPKEPGHSDAHLWLWEAKRVEHWIARIKEKIDKK